VLLDALKMVRDPIIELYTSNIHRREPIYQRSCVSMVATSVMAGLGAEAYPIAVKAPLARFDA
jgi:3-dehydroquinate dehydratase II